MGLEKRITQSTKEEKSYIQDKLLQFNRKYVPPGLMWNYAEVSLTVKDDHEQVVGGLMGLVCWTWLEIDVLWVKEEVRGKGYGTALIKEAERIARSRKCTYLKVNTYSFQAPDFYRKLGFETFGVIKEALPGQHHEYLIKRLVSWNDT